MTKERNPKEKVTLLKKLFKKDDRLLIIINPDPDSIASALALKRLCKPWVKNTLIVQTQKTKRLENKMMQSLLNIKLQDFSKCNPADFTKTAIVDGQPAFFKNYKLPHINIIIDHHPVSEDYPAEFKDIQSQYGATSTMMQEYLEAAGIVPSARIATAMCYGIKTDTENFERGTIKKDAIAFGKLFANAHPEKLVEIDKWNIPKESIPVFKNAIRSFNIKRNVISVFLGEIRIPDYAVLVADFLKSFEGIHICIVIAIVNQNLLIILRSLGQRYHVGQMANASFGKIGSAGGHRSAARIEINLKNLENIIDTKNASRVENYIVRELLKNK